MSVQSWRFESTREGISGARRKVPLLAEIIGFPGNVTAAPVCAMQDYRRLRVWTKTHAHVLQVRRATHRFPRNGYASLKTQTIRSAESIAFNIVEGCGSASQKELARFLDISIKSASELEYQIMLARDYGVLGESDWKSLSEDTINIRRMLCGLRAKVLEADETRLKTDKR